VHLASVFACLITSLQDEKSPLGRSGAELLYRAAHLNNSPGAITQARATTMIPAYAHDDCGRATPLFAALKGR
jgi:hypothetical protein